MKTRRSFLFGALGALFVLALLMPIQTSAAEIISKTATTTTMRFYSSFGDGNLWSVSTEWETCHDASIYVDQNNTYTNINGWISTQYSNISKLYGVSRGFFPFDTSEIPDLSEIISAKLGIYINYHYNEDNDGDNFITIVRTSQAITSKLSDDDINQCGAIDNPIEGVDINQRLNLDVVNNGMYNFIDFNEIGLSWIDKVNFLDNNDNTKGTLLGLREGHDVLDHVLEHNNNYTINRVNIKYSESGTSTAPYLDVTYINPPEEDGLEPVILIPGIMGSWEVDGDWKLDPIFHTYDDLVSSLLDNGYIENETLFLFPYDWRKDNRYTANLLKQKINEVKNISGNDKVDVVAHSMGGLVTRYYLQSDAYADDIDQIIFLDTPQAGAPETYMVYEGAKMTGFTGPIQKFYFETEAKFNGYKKLTEYIRTYVKSTEQLLPVYDYLYERSKGAWMIRNYPNDYPRNRFLERLNNESALDLGYTRAKLYSFVSDNGEDNTVSKIKVKKANQKYVWTHGKVKELIKGGGDGTVPSESLNFLSDSATEFFDNVDHREIVNKSKGLVIETLTGNGFVIDNTYNTMDNYLFIRVYSPVDFQVIGPEGKRIGKDFESSGIFNDFDDGFYSGFNTEAEFVTIANPQPGKYQVILQGVEDGKYELGADLVTGEYVKKEKRKKGKVKEGEVIEYLVTVLNNGKVKIKKAKTKYPAGEDDYSCSNLRKLINHYYKEGGIKKRAVKQFLLAKLKFICKEKSRCSLQSQANNKRLVNKFLDFYLKKNWLTQLAYDDLHIED